MSDEKWALGTGHWEGKSGRMEASMCTSSFIILYSNFGLKNDECQMLNNEISYFVFPSYFHLRISSFYLRTSLWADQHLIRLIQVNNFIYIPDSHVPFGIAAFDQGIFVYFWIGFLLKKCCHIFP